MPTPLLSSRITSFLPKTKGNDPLSTFLGDAVVGFYWSFKPPGWILPKKIMLVSNDASLRFPATHSVVLGCAFV